MEIRNIAIIAHVDHGKTTLVDNLLKQSNTFRENEHYMNEELIMDSNDQERERGITILAKNTAVNYKGVKINIVDTPGHADFGGEVERTLNMADGAILLVDAQEGPMPQTKFVLSKALELGLKIIVLINKIDKKDANIEKTKSKLYDLFLELAVSEDQLEFPILYAIGRDGKCWKDLPTDTSASADLEPIFEQVLETVPAPKGDSAGPFQMLVSSLTWDSYKGKYCIGRVNRGVVSVGEDVALLKSDGISETGKVESIFLNNGLNKVSAEQGVCGDIISITGIKNASIGDTLADKSAPDALPTIAVEEPTLSVVIGPNTSPLMGKEGEFLTGRQILDRIHKELQTNVAMRFYTNDAGKYVISGRGELHLSVFIETLRREGFELEVSKPQVLKKEIDGEILEPIEQLIIDVENTYAEAVKSEVTQKGGTLLTQEQATTSSTRLTFEISTSNLLGLGSQLLTISKGTAVLNSTFLKYGKSYYTPSKTRNGVLIATNTGKSSKYGLNIAQERGVLFIGSGEDVYMGMVVGLNSRGQDLEINVCKEKHLTNTRSAGADDAIILTPATRMSLEQSLGFLEDDELLEITPKSLRIRKKILDPNLRKRASK